MSAEQTLFLEALKGHGKATMRAGGWSMWPWIAVDATVHLESCEAHDVRLGDVVLARMGDRLVLHRAIAWTPNKIPILKGDARLWADEPPRRDAILGRLLRTEDGWLASIPQGRATEVFGRGLALASWLQWSIASRCKRLVR